MPEDRAAFDRIAVDLDNTIVDYDALFVALARERHGTAVADVSDKRTVRDAVRALPEGEAAWQRLQALAYGPCIGGASAYAGARACIARLVAEGRRVFVVSHKTRFAAAAPAGADLHEAARGWLRAHGFVGPGMLDGRDVSFLDSRAAKLARLVELDVALAIDDLPEVLGDPTFPPHVARWLFAPGNAPEEPPDGPWRIVRSWSAVDAALASA